MRKTAFVVFVALTALAAAACKENPTSPSTGPVVDSQMPVETVSTGSDTTALVYKDEDFAGTWQATKAEGRNFWDQEIRRDLVAEGGMVTLILEPGNAYTVTLTMPGEMPRVDTGTWYYHEFWGRPQLDFWTSSIPKSELEYGHGIGFYATLSGKILELSEGGGRFIHFDFGWHDAWGNDWALLDLAFTRQ